MKIKKLSLKLKLATTNITEDSHISQQPSL